MLEMLITVGSLLLYSCATGFCVMFGVKLLDFCMDYPNPLWRIRYHFAMKYTTNPGLLESSRLAADQVSADEKPVVMQTAYDEVVRQNPAFKRLTCVWCLATYIGLFAAGTVALICVPLYGWWVILYWLTVFPWIAVFGRM